MADENATVSTEPTLVDDVKLYLRISHNLLDSEIETVIASARQELKRAGVDPDVADGLVAEVSDLVDQAIKVYAKAYYSDTKDGEKYMESFKYQADNLRKTYPVEES